jgi:D-sedoheptulose 7-phosphate isomerase
MVDANRLRTATLEAFGRRTEPGRALAANAGRVAAACHDMALRFHHGGKLLVFGNGGPATDAQHISVEFVHPVIVGKRALPALSLVNDVATVMGVARRHGIDEVFAHQLDVLGAGEDIALGVSADGECRNVLRGLEAAHAAGMLTVALVGGDGGAIAASPAVDHCFVVASDNPRIVKEVHVTTYHVLWELVHVYFDHPGILDEPGTQAAAVTGGVESLYPFLYAGSSSLPAVLAEVSRSTEEKVAEIVSLRQSVGAQEADRVAACAAVLAERFGDGGKLMAFGNGGSSTDAADIVHTFLDPDGAASPLPALCLTSDAAVMTALTNDVSFEVVFARQLRAFGRASDIAVGISTSGGSANVLRAFDQAKSAGLATVGLAGYGGGKMAELESIDFLFAVPSSSVHRVQEVQTTLYHVLWEVTQAALKDESASVPSLAPATGS